MFKLQRKDTGKLALNLAHQDFPLLHPDETVEEALNKFRKKGLPHKIIYLYVVDREGHLLGVLPTRRLLISDLETKIADIFVKKAVALNRKTTTEEARGAFSKYKFLAFPIVDDDNRVLGVIDIEHFAGDLGNIHERTRFDDIYELLGVASSAKSERSAFASFRMRFPWLIATLVSGGFAAFLTSAFETTLREALILAFFLTMVLGLSESVCMQSATLTLQKLHKSNFSNRSFLSALRLEIATASLIGLACGIVAGGLAAIWRNDLMGGVSIAISLFFSLIFSCLWGFVVPTVLRNLNKDPKVAAAPIALGISDLSTLFFYFFAAKILLS